MSTANIPTGFSDPDAAAGPVSIRQPVAWGELDALGHVNNTVYLRWFENVRISWFERIGMAAIFAPQGHQGIAMGPILARLECDYRMPVGFPDVIWASARCVEIGRSSLTLQKRIWSERRAAIVAEGAVVMVMYDYAAQRSTAIPEAVRAAIVALDQPRERGGKT
jgi:acyl-CoA thioester hydrolase